MRRLSLALTGTIPSLEEIRRFEARPAGDRVRPWLDGLLRDRRCADYLAERLARAFVGTEDGPFLVFRRRRFVSWLSDELLQNRPYDAIVRDLIAGQGLWTDHPATNFVTVTFDPETKEPNPERLAARVARAFLGVRLDCAQCHDHPFQPWKQADFRGLAAFFGQVQSGFSGIHDGDGEFRASDRKTGVSQADRAPRPVRRRALQAGRDPPRAAGRVGHATRENPYFARATVNRAWALMFGRPLVEPVDDLAAAGRPPAVLTLLADDFAAHGYDLRRLIRAIAATEAFGLDSAADSDAPSDKALEAAWAAFPMTRLRPEQVAGGLLQASSLETIDAESHILVRLTDPGAVRTTSSAGTATPARTSSTAGGGTIPQRLLMMNGDLVHEKTKDELGNAADPDRPARPHRPLGRRGRLPRHPDPPPDPRGGRPLRGPARRHPADRPARSGWPTSAGPSSTATEFSWNH